MDDISRSLLFLVMLGPVQSRSSRFSQRLSGFSMPMHMSTLHTVHTRIQQYGRAPPKYGDLHMYIGKYAL